MRVVPLFLMRKIESLMVQAIKDGRDWKSSNTEVQAHPSGNNEMRVFLHGNHIASYKDGNLLINNCGWRTNTTKSRLNAIINEFLDGTKNGIYQKNHCWYVIDHGRHYNFDHGAWYYFKSNALDVTHTVTNSELVAV